MATSQELGACYEPGNKQKCTEPERERRGDDLIELDDNELNYIYFGTDSGDASNKSGKGFVV